MTIDEVLLSFKEQWPEGYALALEYVQTHKDTEETLTVLQNTLTEYQEIEKNYEEQQRAIYETYEMNLKSLAKEVRQAFKEEEKHATAQEESSAETLLHTM